MAKKSIVIAHGGDLSDATGGTNRIMAFSRSLYNNGYDVHLVIPKPKKDITSCFRGIKLHQIFLVEKGVKNQLLRAILISVKAKQLANKLNAILQIELSTLAGIATLFGCSNFILDVNDISVGDPQYMNLPFPKVVNKFIYKMEHRAVLNASKIIVVSNPMKNFIINEWNIPDDHFEVIPNGFFHQDLDKLGISGADNDIDEKKIVYLGTLFGHLDTNIILNLGRSLKDQGVVIYLVGDGVLRPALQKQIEKDNLKNIVITGWLPYSEAMKFTINAALVIHAITRSLTTEVACPVKILDYAALGKTMVLSDVCELSTILNDKNIALVSDPEKPDDFINNVRYALQNTDLRRGIASKIMNFSHEYTWEKQGEKLVKVLNKI